MRWHCRLMQLSMLLDYQGTTKTKCTKPGAPLSVIFPVLYHCYISLGSIYFPRHFVPNGKQGTTNDTDSVKGTEPTRCDKSMQLYCLNMFRATSSDQCTLLAAQRYTTPGFPGMASWKRKLLIVLLMMGILVPETCWGNKTAYFVASSWFFILFTMSTMHGHMKVGIFLFRGQWQF
jgi:hypothetical protein